MGMTSIMTCQIICLLVIIPVAALARMYERDQNEIQVMQTHHPREMVVLPPLAACILGLCVFTLTGMELNRLSSTALIVIYGGYVYYSSIVFYGDSD
mmetsp:Transcript_22078/g.27142  ORF Transcript_22078/g.27142 Transcript_22078/m.27142 type:complete len:97 (-) Transcript_22078:147-437(-)